MKIRDEDVIQTLTAEGVPLDRWLAIGKHLVGYIDESGRLMMQVYENDAFSAAASKLLQKRGQIHEGAAGEG